MGMGVGKEVAGIDMAAGKGIQFISPTIVKAASYTEEEEGEERHGQIIELLPWDLQFLLVGPIQKGLLFINPTLDEPVNSVIHRLKESLSLALDFFPPLAGRLVETKHDDNTSSFSILCNNAGAEFGHAVAGNVTVADILEPVYVPEIVHSFFRLNGVKNCDGVSKPLLGVQVTELVDGIFVGCTINHVVADGTSFWNFFNFWSEISRSDSDSIVTNHPILQRFILDSIVRPIKIRLPEDEKLSDRSLDPPPLKERVFHFTKEKIAALKAKANADIGSSSNQISSLQALLAHLWQSINHSRCLRADQDTYVSVLVGCRSRLQPTLPNNYFGNAVQSGSVTMNAGELLEKGLGYVALQMNKMVALQTDETARTFLESWAKNPRIITLGSFPKYSLLTSSSPRFNVYGPDFGGGKAVAVRSGGGNKVDGKITLFSGVEEGSVDTEVCLLAETLEAMANDQDFMDAVTV